MRLVYAALTFVGIVAVALVLSFAVVWSLPITGWDR